jgi:hypothetical protein
MHKIDVTKGQLVSTVSQQWAMRPADERFTSLSSLRAQVAQWAEESNTAEIAPGKIVVDPTTDGGLRLMTPEGALDLNHFSFGQIANIAKAPANYLRTLPPALAALNVNYGLKAAEQKPASLYLRTPTITTDLGGAPVGSVAEKLLRGVTSTKYGRILDRDVVDAVMKVAGDGTGDTRWKVPGTIQWGGAHGITYNPNVDITAENTTLYASDRDVFLFLVDDMHPIEVGKLADGSPDLMFRGFYVWNSEVGHRSFGVATMYLRGVCQNRNLWGVEGFSELTFKHTSDAPDRFVEFAAPALETYAEGSTAKLVEGVRAAKAAVVSKTDEERIEFLRKFGFSEKQAKTLIATGEAEEGEKPVTVWDHAQAISAQARKAEFQDKRLHLELVAGKVLNKVQA